MHTKIHRQYMYIYTQSRIFIQKYRHPYNNNINILKKMKRKGHGATTKNVPQFLLIGISRLKCYCNYKENHYC